MNKCYMPGVPRLMYMGYPFQIFETEKYVAIVSEYAHVYRMIYLDGTPHLDFPGLWNGDSRGHWDGDTLVTDVTNFNDHDVAGQVRQLSQRSTARHRTVHAHGTGFAALRGHHQRSDDVHEGLEDRRAHDSEDGSHGPADGV